MGCTETSDGDLVLELANVSNGPQPLLLLLDLPCFRHATVSVSTFNRLWKQSVDLQGGDSLESVSNGESTCPPNAMDESSSSSLEDMVCLADRVMVNSAIFAEFWKGAGSPKAVGKATRRVLDVWAKKLSLQSIEGVLSSTPLDISQWVAADSKSGQDPSQEV